MATGACMTQDAPGAAASRAPGWHGPGTPARRVELSAVCIASTAVPVQCERYCTLPAATSQVPYKSRRLVEEYTQFTSSMI